MTERKNINGQDVELLKDRIFQHNHKKELVIEGVLTKTTEQCEGLVRNTRVFNSNGKITVNF